METSRAFKPRRGKVALFFSAVALWKSFRFFGDKIGIFFPVAA